MVIEATLRMDAILKYLLEHLGFLYKDYGFRFVDSLHSDTFGGNGQIILQSQLMVIRLTNDRGQLFFDCQSLINQKKNEWYSIDLLWNLITNKICDSAVLDDSKYPSFLQEHFNTIVELFSPEKVDETTSELKRLKRLRAKRLFG